MKLTTTVFVLGFVLLGPVVVHGGVCPNSVTTLPNCTVQLTVPNICPDDTIFKSAYSVGACAPCSSAAQAGFVCKDKAVALCALGHYCPWNATSLSYNEEIECPSGSMCMPGFIAPFPCRALVTCQAGATRIKVGPGALIGLFFVAFLVCGLGGCVRFFQVRAIKQSAALRNQIAPSHVQSPLAGSVANQGLGHDLKSYTSPVTVEFQNVGMKLKSNGKEILAGVTGYYPPGSLVALMGPSGGGKTTFMNALLGRASCAHVSGSVKINGVEGGLTKAANIVGFVPQDDIVFPNLTVYQNIFYNAMLRLPAEVDFKTKQVHVQEVINILGLSHIQNDLVGSPEKRGVSGGQKKRVNIGMELAAMPCIVFMDEPTSGLDGAATLELALCLATLRESGLTIICVIHQPRYTVFEKFSHVLLFGAGGRQVYGGRTEKIQTYLERLSFRLPAKENPADWMIDVVCNLAPRYLDPTGEEVDASFKAPGDLFKIWNENHKANATDPASEWNSGTEQEERQALVPLKMRRVPNVFVQTAWILQRILRQHSNASFFTMLGVLLFAGVLFGALGGKNTFAYGSLYSTLGTQSGLIGMIVAIQTHALLHPEKLNYYRESKSGVSSFAFGFSKMIYDVVRTFLYTLTFVFPKFLLNMPMMEFRPFVSAWFGYTWYWSGAGLFVAVTLDSGVSGMLLLVFWPTMEMFFNGTLGATLGYMDAMSDIQYAITFITSGRWLYQLLYASELAALPEHTHSFKVVVDCLNNNTIPSDLSHARDQATTALWLLGAGWRVLTLASLFLIKYSQGGNCVTKIWYVITHNCLDKCILESDKDELVAVELATKQAP